MGHAELSGGLALKGGYRLAENELLRLEHVAEGVEQLLAEGLVLALEVQHGYGLDFGG